MRIKFTTLLGIAACALASTAAFLQPSLSRDAVVVAQNNGMSDDTRDKTMIQKQTDPRENGTSQSESRRTAPTRTDSRRNKRDEGLKP